MIQIKQAVIVEGKYDKIKVSNILDTLIIETDGFGIFKDKNKQKLIRRLAETRGILILTDSDSAGFTIRSFLNGIVPKEQLINVYIPDIFGKEKRKSEPSKEGKLGVEGVKSDVIIDALKKAGVKFDVDAEYPKKHSLLLRPTFFLTAFPAAKTVPKKSKAFKAT